MPPTRLKIPPASNTNTPRPKSPRPTCRGNGPTWPTGPVKVNPKIAISYQPANAPDSNNMKKTANKI